MAATPKGKRKEKMEGRKEREREREKAVCGFRRKISVSARAIETSCFLLFLGREKIIFFVCVQSFSLSCTFFALSAPMHTLQMAR